MSVKQTTRDRINEVLSFELGIANPERFVNESVIDEDVLMDSLEKIEFVMAIEEEFGIAIPDIKRNSLNTLGELMTFIDEELSKTEPTVA